MLRWSRPNIPHRGWKYFGMEDLGDDVYPGETIPYEQCEMCGKERIRYVHLLRHPDYNGELRVGCDCASKMTEDYRTPREQERNLQNRASRRRNFLKQEWWYKSETGNYTLRYRGEQITIMKSRFGPGWGVIFNGRQRWDYNGRKITNLDTAKIVAFNLFDELHESQNQQQPYWEAGRWIYR